MTDVSISRRALVRAAAFATAIGVAAPALIGRASAGVLDALGIKKLLGKASDSSLDKLGATDGFYRDTAVRIVLPGTKGKLARKLLRTGDKLGVTNKLSKSINDAASLAAKEAKPIFRSSIDNLKLSDVPGIATQKDGATQYLRGTAGVELGNKVRPLMIAALTKVGAFDQLAKLNTGGLGRALGLTNDKLTNSVTDQAMNGIFSYIGGEEANLRGNPGKILDKVF